MTSQISLSLKNNLIFHPKLTRTRKRRKYTECLAGAPKFLNNGVKMVLVLAVTPGEKEEQKVIEVLFKQMNCKIDSVYFVPDLKLVNILLGIGNHT